MIYETYATSLRSGRVEFGFTFKVAEDCDDSLFDLALGEVDPLRSGQADANAEMNEGWAENEWAAKAIVENAP